MTPSRYMVAITTSLGNNERIQGTDNEDLWLEVLNITRGFQIYGSQNRNGSMELHILPASRKNRQELNEQLKAVNGVLNVSVVEISKPVKEAELTEVRKLLAGIGLDGSKVSKDALALFIEDKLEGEYKNVIQQDRRRMFEVPVPISIIRTEELPEVTPDMLKGIRGHKIEYPDRPLTKDDFQTYTEEVILEETIEDPSHNLEAPPPAPPAPAKLNTMTDDEIKLWVLKKDPRNLKYEHLQVKRTLEEVTIIIKHNGYTESFAYKLNKG